MDYNFGRTFKDVLKIVSLGMMATINGVSGDVFAFEGKDHFPRARGAFNRHSVLGIQGGEDPEILLQMALALSLAEDDAPYAAAAAAVEDEENRNLAFALEFQERLNAGILDQGAHPRGAAAAADDEDKNYALALKFQEELNSGLDQGVQPHGAAAAAEDDEDWKLAIALQFGGELNAGLYDQGAHPRGAAAAVTKAKDWDVDPSALLHQHWEKHQIEGEGFVTYISKQGVAVYNELKEERGEGYPFDRNAIREMAVRLKTLNTGDGVSAKIDQVLADLL